MTGLEDGLGLEGGRRKVISEDTKTNAMSSSLVIMLMLMSDSATLNCRI